MSTPACPSDLCAARDPSPPTAARRKVLLQGLVGAALMAVGSPVLAFGCYSTGMDTVYVYMPPITRTETIGAIMATTTAYGSSKKVVEGCLPGGRYYYSRAYGSATSLYATTATNVPGVGVQVRQIKSPYFCLMDFFPFSCFGDGRSGRHYGRDWGVRIDLVRIPGTLSSGSLSARATNHMRAQVWDLYTVDWQIRGTVPSAPQCTVTASNVHLGEVEIAKLVDSNYSTPQAFDVRYSGCTGKATITSRFYGTAAPGRSDLFATSGSATGVGIRLTDQTDVQIPPNGTRVHYGVVNGTVIRYLARYERIAERPTAGSANASLTITSTFN